MKMMAMLMTTVNGKPDRTLTRWHGRRNDTFRHRMKCRPPSDWIAHLRTVSTPININTVSEGKGEWSHHIQLAQALGDQVHKTFQGVKLKGYFPFFQMTQWNLKNNTVHPAPFYFFFSRTKYCTHANGRLSWTYCPWRRLVALGVIGASVRCKQSGRD